jgi:sulfur transfer protein SufE
LHASCITLQQQAVTSGRLALQVWVHAEQAADGRLRFAADSDSELTRGLAAVLVRALSGLTLDEVLQVCTPGRAVAAVPALSSAPHGLDAAC